MQPRGRTPGHAGPVRCLIAGAVALQAGTVSAQRSEPATLTALAITEPIRLDGRLDESAWQRAVRITNFTQRELDFGAPVTERTEVAVLYDDEAMYVGFWGFDREPRRLRANQMARDFRFSTEDNFEIVLDPFDDDRTGYLFVTNPNGARADALIADNGGTINRDWDGVWDVRTHRSAEGWFAEFRIPFSTLRYRAGDASWGINFERNIRRKREQAMWQGWSRDFDLEQVRQAGVLSGIRTTGGARLLDARPFAAGGVEWSDGRNRESLGHIGLDLGFQPSPEWRFNATVNPDFAQVEADREEVNLTRFSLFYPEKRPFFLEGQEFFQFDLGDDVRPFYSRTIGLAADRTEVPIRGGVRALGRVQGTTLGAMVLATGDGSSEPARQFGVVRWKRDVLEESNVGLLAVARREPGRTNATLGADFRFGTSSLFGERSFETGLSVARSFTSDADDRFGLAHRAFIAFPNDLVDFTASWTRVDSAFVPDAGYLRRSGFQQFAAELSLSPRPGALPVVQQIEFKPFELSWYLDDRQNLESLYFEIVPLAFTMRSGDGFEFNIQRRADTPDEDFEIVEDEVIPAGTYWFSRWALEASTFAGRSVSLQVETGGGDFYAGTRLEYGGSVSWKASRFLSLAVDWQHNRIRVNDRTFDVDETGGRMDLALSPKLFGAVAAQWNTEDREVILNFRLNWIPTPGSDLFVVVNHLSDERARWSPLRTTVLSKIVWRFTL